MRSGLLLFLVLSVSASLPAADWQRIGVPGTWEEKGPEEARHYDGVAWYRTWVKMADNAFTPHERNLFEESVGVNIRDLADAHEVFVNGRQIGAGGRFPPDFRSGREEMHHHKVPVGTLRKGQWNEIAIRVFNRSGPGGFRGDAPFIMGYSNECVLEGAWEFRLGDGYQPGGPRADQPAATSFDRFAQSNRVLGRTAQLDTGPKLPPAESAAKITSAAGLTMELILAEPLVAQGTHMSFDERGRLWVSQYRQYPYPAGVRMISRDMYYRSHYDRVPPAPPNHDRGADIVSIHEDTDGDGTFDRHKVFQDGLNLANAAVRGRGGVWVMHTPYLLFYPDRDFDDVPDGPPVVHLQGFGLEDTHASANGLAWGPDGWLYGAQGSSTSSRVTRPGVTPADAEGVYFEGCMVWRYHPETREYEIFSEGSGNTFGLELDAHGRFYSGLNSGASRGWHYVQGGVYLMQGVNPGKFGPPRNPYAFGDLPKMHTLTTVRRFSHFGAYAEGTAMPSRYQGHLMAIDPLHNEIIDVERSVRGSTFETRDLSVAVKSEDVAFRPIFIVNAPDGSMFVSDMYEYYIAHGQHYQNRIDPGTGRIYRLRGADMPLERDTNLAGKSSTELVKLLAHPNKWHRHTAARVLGERRDPAIAASLKYLLATDRDVGAMTALWALEQMGQLNDETTLAAFQHPYAMVRMWAVQFLGNKYGINRGLGLPPQSNSASLPQAGSTGSPPAALAHATELPARMMQALSDLTRREPNAEVRSQVASTARRLRTPQALALVSSLITHDTDVSDPYIPLLTWLVLEAHIKVSREAVVDLLKSPAFWQRTVAQEHLLPRLMRRFALEGRRQDLLLCARLLRMAETPQQAAYLMKGFEEAFRGRSMVGLPDELLQALAASGRIPLVLRVRQGEPEAIRIALATIGNPKASIDERLLHARTFGEVRHDAAIPVLLNLATGTAPAALRKAAFVSLMTYDQEDIGAKVVSVVPKLTGDVRTAALALLASRASWSGRLMDAVASGRMAANDIPPDIVARMRGHESQALRDRLAKMFPVAVKSGGADWHQRILQVEAKLKQGAGNPYAGDVIYMERCASCHKLFFKGGRIGPDLTTYQRDNLGTMLLSIINPNAEIREGFEYFLVQTTDGRTLSGFLIERDQQIMVLRGLEGEDITLRQEEVKELQPMGRSLMPEGLLDGLSDPQLRDLFAYLRISQPITR